MKIIRPSFEILSNTNGADFLRAIEVAGRTCYKAENKITQDSAQAFAKKLIDSKHEAMIEHCSITVRVICDRGVSHEIVRHRIASYAQESTRYCNYSKDKFGRQLTFIQPEWISKDLTGEHIFEWDGLYGECETEPIEMNDVNWWFWSMALAERNYFKLLEHGWSAQQARTVLPNSLKTEIVMTMNLREWRHFFKLRTDTPAHPQMREIAIPMLQTFKKLYPVFFDDIM